MVVSKSDDHYWSNDNLAVHDDGFLLDGVHTEHGGLWEVNDWSAVQRTKHAAVGAEHHSLIRLTVNRKIDRHGESTSSHILESKFTVSGLQE